MTEFSWKATLRACFSDCWPMILCAPLALLQHNWWAAILLASTPIYWLCGYLHLARDISHARLATLDAAIAKIDAAIVEDARQ